MTYALTVTTAEPFERTLEATRDALTDQGFGILTEIDLAGTLAEKLGEEVPPQVVLGACRPPLALAALRAEPSIGLLLPCNVAVRAEGPDSTVVEAMDPDVMVDVTKNPRLAEVAADARERLEAALAALLT